MRVGLCRDSAPSNSTPMRGVGGSRDGEHFAPIIFHFFYCYINMLKGAFNSYLLQMDVSGTVNSM